MSGDGTGIGGHLLKATLNATKVVVDATKVVVDAIKVVVDAIKVVVDATKVVVDAIKVVTGTNADNHDVNTLSGKSHLLMEHTHSIAMIHPELANPVQLQKASGVWAAYGTPTEIIPAGEITDDFDLHFGIVSAIGANGDYTIEIYEGAALSEVQIAHIAITRNAVQSQEGAIPIITPLISANTRISAALSSGNAAQDTLELKLMYHVY